MGGDECKKKKNLVQLGKGSNDPLGGAAEEAAAEELELARHIEDDSARLGYRADGAPTADRGWGHRTERPPK